MSEIGLTKLAEPFPLEDIEWRVSRSGRGSNGIFCMALAYITARAIQKRLDDVCGPENWKNEEPQILDVNGKSAFAGGISIRIGLTAHPVGFDSSGSDHNVVGDEWVTKWDVAEPTNVEPAKGGFSGAMKRAGAQWGIGRYLYYLDETFAEVSDSQPSGSRRWNYARLSEKHGGGVYYWNTPSLPAWALPKDPEHEISPDELHGLKQLWRAKFVPDVQDPKDLREGFSRFVASVAGEFPASDHTCWTRAALDKCIQRIETTTDPDGVDSDVPFEE